MARYELKIEDQKEEPKTDPVKVEIMKDDNGEINIFFDFELVAWISTIGELWLTTTLSDSSKTKLEAKGIKFEHNHIALSNLQLAIYPEE